MSGQADRRPSIWEYARTSFAFLVDYWGFEGPEPLKEGLAYHRPGLHIMIELWSWKNETGFTTTVQSGTGASGRQRTASLGCVYVACGLGPIQDVPEGAGTQHTIRKRIRQHSSALVLVMPYLDGDAVSDLITRCHGRDLPND